MALSFNACLPVTCVITSYLGHGNSFWTAENLFQTIWTGEEYGFDQPLTDEEDESSGDGNDRARESNHFVIIPPLDEKSEILIIFFLFFSIRRAVANVFSTTWAAEGGVCLNKVIGSVDREVDSSNQNNTICLLLLSGFRAFRSHLAKTCWKSRWETCKKNIKRGRFFPLRLNPVHPSSAFEDLVDKKWENHQRISNILEVSLTSLFLISLRLRMTWAPCGLPLINTR